MAGHRQDQQALPLLAEQKLGPSQICKVIIILQQGMRENIEETQSATEDTAQHTDVDLQSWTWTES